MRMVRSRKTRSMNPLMELKTPMRLLVLSTLVSLTAFAQEAEAPAVPEDAQQTTAPAELERRIDVLAEELERLRLGDVVPEATEGRYGLGPAASKVYRAGHGVSLGGYGEMLYRNFMDPEKNDVFDFLRAILYVGYKFNDKWVLNTEIEIEHADEVYLEFGYIDYLWRDEMGFRAGLLLAPMGLVNELHEPTVFLGALRPDTEQRLLPSTWRENGAGIFGEVGPVSYRAYVMNGLKGSGFRAAGLRGGRQKGASALSNHFGAVARVDYTGVQGLLVGGSAYYGGSGQELEPSVPTFIYEGHVDYKFRGLELRGLFARAHLDQVAALNEAAGLTGAGSVGELLQGWYAQAGFDVLSLLSGAEMALTPFVRWERLDTQRRVPEGFASNPANDTRILTVGASFFPISQVVLKGEYQHRRDRAGGTAEQANVLLGYIF
jgi:hypothetical protein